MRDLAPRLQPRPASQLPRGCASLGVCRGGAPAGQASLHPASPAHPEGREPRLDRMENSTFHWYQTGEQVKQRGAYVWFDLKGLVMKMNSIHMHSQPKSRRLLSIPSLATGLCFLLLSAYCTLAAGQVDYSAAASSPFVDPATLDRSIPTPSSVIGH